MAGKLTVLAGMPAAGKSSYARATFNLWEIVPYDDMARYFQGCYGDCSPAMHIVMAEIVEGRLIGQGTVCVDFTNLQPEERSHWLSLARSWDAEADLVFLDTPYWLCAFRNYHRSQPIPEIILKKCYDQQRAALTNIRSEQWDHIKIIHEVPEESNPPLCRECNTPMDFVWDARFKAQYVFYCATCQRCRTMSHLDSPFSVIPGGKTA